MSDLRQIEGITFDFYNTLVSHPGPGRGRQLIDYLVGEGYGPAPWEHGVLYEVFRDHDDAYSPRASAAERTAYYEKLARRVFRRLAISVSSAEVARHAGPLWEILGPSSFSVFPEVSDTLDDLKGRGLALGLISNWQSGVRHFCEELGLSPYLDLVVGSADLGLAKPDRRIFGHAADRMDFAPSRLLHVGDSLVEDYHGAAAAGFAVVLVDRDPASRPPVDPVIRGIDELPHVLAVKGGRPGRTRRSS